LQQPLAQQLQQLLAEQLQQPLADQLQQTLAGQLQTLAGQLQQTLNVCNANQVSFWRILSVLNMGTLIEFKPKHRLFYLKLD
jgi:hypothetical protein